MGASALLYAQNLQRNEQADDRKQQFSDAYRKDRIAKAMAAASTVNKAIQTGQYVDPQTQQTVTLTPEQKAAFQNSANLLDKHIRDLYNPNYDPNTAQPVFDQLAGKFGTPAQPGIVDRVGQFKKDYKAIFGADAPEDKVTDYFNTALGIKDSTKPDIENWQRFEAKLPDGKVITLTQNTKDGRVAYLDGTAVPSNVLQGVQGIPKPTAASKPKKGWSKDDKGRFFSVLLDPTTNQPLPGTQNYDDLPPTNIVGSITTGYFHYVDQTDGSVHQVPETKTRMPNRGTNAPAASVPPTGTPTPTPTGTDAPAPTAPKSGKRPPAPKALTDRIIGNKGTKDLVDTKATYQAAIDRQQTMHLNYENALKGDQQAMLSLVANHIGMTLGAQKGARINQAVWNEAVESVPWINKIQAKFDDRGYLSGVTLAPEQMKQMVDLADEKVDILQKHIDRLNMERNQAGIAQPQGGGGGQRKVVSLTKAMAMPQNAGKTADQVRADIQAHGYEVGK